jgi:hypothetical protein
VTDLPRRGPPGQRDVDRDRVNLRHKVRRKGR